MEVAIELKLEKHPLPTLSRAIHGSQVNSDWNCSLSSQYQYELSVTTLSNSVSSWGKLDSNA